MMERPESLDLLPVEVEEQLTRLLEQWTNDHRLPEARVITIREAVQERDAWDQRFWTRMSTVLMHATAAVQRVPSKPWSMAPPIHTDLARISSQNSFDDPSYCPYLRLGA